MDNEYYEATMGINYTPFEKAIKTMTSLFTGFSNTVNTTKLKLEISNQEAYLEQLKKEFIAVDEAISLGRGNAEMQKKWEFLRGAINSNTDQLEKLKQELAEVGDESDKSAEKASQLPNILKKMGMSLIGVQSAFSAFRKVVSTALSNNIELSNKFNAIWQALGNAITPILERIANLVLRAFAYLNIFVKTLSGGKIDLLAKTSKSAGSTAKSLKEANKQLAGFDELQNIDEDTGGGGGAGIGGGIADPFADVDLNPEWVDTIQAFGEWVKINWPLVVALIGGTWAAIKAGFDLKDITGLWLLLGGIYEIFQGLHNLWEGALNHDLDQISKGFAELAIGIGLVSIAISLLTGNWTFLYGLIATGLMLIVSWVLKNWDEIKQACVNLWNNIKEGWNNTKQAIIDKVAEIKQRVADKWAEIKTNFTTMVDGIKTKWNDFKTNMVNKVEEIKTGIKGKINGIIGFFEGLANSGIRAINKVVQAFNKISFNIPSWVPVIGGKSFGFNLKQMNEISLARLDTGTNYVPNDQLAMIHKGEAVIPKKFNSEEFFGGNSETAEKLDRLIDLIEGIDFQPYITVKDIGQTATRYQNQQVRIMGGKV